MAIHHFLWPCDYATYECHGIIGGQGSPYDEWSSGTSFAQPNAASDGRGSQVVTTGTYDNIYSPFAESFNLSGVMTTTDPTAYIFEGWIYIASLSSLTDWYDIMLTLQGDALTALSKDIQIDGNGAIRFFNGTTGYASSSGVISSATWHFIQIFCEVGSSSDGSVRIDVDLTNVVDQSSITTHSAAITNFGIRHYQQSSSVTLRYDDWVFTVDDAATPTLSASDLSTTDKNYLVTWYGNGTDTFGTAPDSTGTWASIQYIWSGTAAWWTNTADITSGQALSGGSAAGPLNDTRVNGTITAMMAGIYASRSGGSGGFKTLRIGTETDGLASPLHELDLADALSTQNYDWHVMAIPESDVATLAADYILTGIRHSGGRDYQIASIEVIGLVEPGGGSLPPVSPIKPFQHLLVR